MTYRHKKDHCMKDTKEIVENILQSEASDYDLADPAEIVTSGKTIQIIRGETAALERQYRLFVAKLLKPISFPQIQKK
ncbi:MAG: hypothetical protein ACTSSD_18235 [Candidatus Thorarchaeota archaeon]